MAAGQPVTGADTDQYLLSLLGGDAALQLYAPGGVWPERPPKGAVRPIIRWWERIANKDTIRQDGMAGRAQSNPEYIVCLLDVQQPEEVDRYYGSIGGALEPKQAYFNLGVKRIYSLLHNRLTTFNGIDYYSIAISEYLPPPATNTVGEYEVVSGYVFQLRIT